VINSSGNLNNTKKTIINKLIKNNKNKIKKNDIWVYMDYQTTSSSNWRKTWSMIKTMNNKLTMQKEPRLLAKGVMRSD
jgi:hypothetical protein